MKKLIGLLIVLSLAFAGNITPTGMNQEDLYKLLDNLTYSRMYQTLGKPGLTYSSAATANLKTASSVTYVNNGIMYTLAASSNIKVPTTGKSSATLIQRTRSAYPTTNFVLNVNASGIAYISSSLGNYMPPKVSGYTPIGAIRIGLHPGNYNGYTFGTTLLNAASMNVTYYDLSAYSTGTSKVSLTNL